MSDGLPELRASDAERDRAIVRLREAAAEGRLTLEEFTQRMSHAVEARTHGELGELTRDLPAEALPATPPARPRLRWVVSVMGNTTRRGRWKVGERTVAVCAMGNATIDLRDAVLAGPEVEILVFCAMGNVNVVVPDGVEVDLAAVAFMGNKFDRSRRSAGPTAPLVRIGGFVTMGNVVVRTDLRHRELAR
jgi:hypothetical protein